MIVSIIITGYVYHRLSKSQQRILQNNYMHNIFNWNEIPGKDCFKFTHFLIKNFDVNWVKTGKFEKTEGGKKLYIQSENNYLTLQLNDEKTEAKLTIDETNKCIFKVKNDNLYFIRNDLSKLILLFVPIFIQIISIQIYIQEKHKMISSLLDYITSGLIEFLPIAAIATYSLITFLVLSMFIQGHVIIDMENIYYKDDSLIPVSIQLTGPDSGLLIKLFEEKSYDLNPKTGILVLDNQHSLRISSNDSLVGNRLGFGKYRVFINTTNLSPGYYELMIERPRLDTTYVTSFYLLNNRVNNQSLNNQNVNNNNMSINPDVTLF